MFFPVTVYRNIVSGSTGVILNYCGKLTVDMRLKGVSRKFVVGCNFIFIPYNFQQLVLRMLCCLICIQFLASV